MSERHLVVVGASLAGLRAVEAARKTGFTGPITLIGGEKHLPTTVHRCRRPISKQDRNPSPPNSVTVAHSRMNSM